MPKLRELPPEALDKLEELLREIDTADRTRRMAVPFEPPELLLQALQLGKRVLAWPREHGLVPPLRWSMRIDTLMQKIVARFPAVLAHLPDDDLSLYFIDEQQLDAAWHFPIRDPDLEQEADSNCLSPTHFFHADQKRILVVGPVI
jgi:hypothetical protein